MNSPWELPTWPVEALGYTLSTEAHVICCNCSFPVWHLGHSFSGREDFTSITSVMSVHLHSRCFFFFKSDITDSVAVILSRLCGQNRLYLISWKLQGAISMKEKKIQIKNQRLPTCRCCLVTKLYPTLCDPTDCSMPGFPILYYLLKFAQIRVHWVGDLTISPSAAFFSFFTSIYFTYGNVYVSVLLSQFAPPSLSPAVSKVCSLCFHLSSCPANQYRSFYFIYMH